MPTHEYLSMIRQALDLLDKLLGEAGERTDETLAAYDKAIAALDELSEEPTLRDRYALAILSGRIVDASDYGTRTPENLPDWARDVFRYVDVLLEARLLKPTPAKPR